MNNLTLTYTHDYFIEAEGVINNAQSQIDLILPSKIYSPTQDAIFGIISFNARYTRTIQFVHIREQYWRANLDIEKDDMPYLSNTTIRLLIASYSNGVNTNNVKLTFDMEAVNLSIRNIKNTEIADLKKEVAALKQTLNAIAKNYSLNIITMQDTSYIQPGMVPMAIEGGKFVAQFPFADTLKSVNGVRSADGNAKLTADDIPVTDEMTLADFLTAVRDALEKQNEVAEAMSEQLTKANNEIAELKIKLAQATNKGLL